MNGVYSGLFGEYLVTERRGRRDLDDVKLVFGRPMTIVAGIGQQRKGSLEPRQVLLCNRLADAVHRREDHRYRRNLRPVGAKTLDVVQRLPDLIYLEIGQLPVLCGACKPQLFMVHLNARHKFAQAGSIAITDPALQAVYLHLQGRVIRAGLTTGDKYP